MAVLIITAKPSFIPPDMDDNYHGWVIHNENGIEFYSMECGPHKLFITECISKVDTRQRIKHTYISKYVKSVKALCESIPDEDFFLITHDKDLMHGMSHAEGIYREASVDAIGSDLRCMIPDNHIYVFMHSDGMPMYDTLITNSFHLTHELIDSAITIIKECNNEAPQA